MRINKLKQLMDEGKAAAGMGLFSGDPVFLEIIGHCGLDFVFIDTEHTPFGQDRDLENLIRAADAVGISAVVRIAHNDEVAIRKCFEFGAAAVAVPHIKTAEDVRKMVEAVKFPPMGKRGVASDVRASNYCAAEDFDWAEYIRHSNENTMLIPMCEDPEFFDNIDEILEVPGISAILFGSTDLSMAMGIQKLYQIDNPQIRQKFEILSQKAGEKGIPLVCTIAPLTFEKAWEMAKQGVRILILKNDISNFKNMVQELAANIVKPLRQQKF